MIEQKTCTQDEHLTEDKVFKSDKYNWCPEGFFPLKLTDTIAQEAILMYAEKTEDKVLAVDLKEAVRVAREKKE